MFTLPSRDSKTWSQSNSSSSKGVLQRTRNIQFDDDVFATLAKRARSIYGATGAFARTTAIVYYAVRNEYLVMTTQGILIVNGTTLVGTNGTDALNAPGSDSNGLSDFKIWQNRVYSIGPSSNGLRYYNSSGAWSTSQYATTGAGALAVFESKNYLAVAQTNTVLLLDTSHALVGSALALRTEQVVTTIEYWNDYIVVGTRNINNGQAYVFLWNGDSALPNIGYAMGTFRVSSIKKYQDTFIVTTSLGQILKYNGGGFDELDSFPIYYKEADWDLPPNFTSGRIINNGVLVDGDLIYINVSPRILLPTVDTANHIFENYFEGGIWCYDPKIKLHHRYSHTSSLRSSETIATSAVNTGTNVITVTSAPLSGTPILYDSSSGTAISGLVNRTKYYAIYVSSTTIKLATTYENAINGIPISLGGTGNSSQLLITLPNRDFGGSTLGDTTSTSDAGGAIALVSNRENSYRTNLSNIMFGTKIGTNTITGAFGLAVATWGQENRGYLITSRLPASNLTEQFQNVSIKYHGIKTAEDKIIVKYRSIQRNDTLTGIDQALTMTATWTNNQIFTTTADISSAKIGDEVSFHSGSGSGYMPHITAISQSGGTYTVTIDEPVQNIMSGDTCGFVIENWNKLGEINTTDDSLETFTNDNGDRYTSHSGLKSFKIDKPSKWIEIKLEIRGEDVAIEEILVNNRPFKTYLM